MESTLNQNGTNDSQTTPASEEKKQRSGRLFHGVKIQFRALEEAKHGVIKRGGRSSREDVEYIAGFLQAIKEGHQESFIVPVADKKLYGRVKRFIQKVASTMDLPITISPHVEGAMAWRETPADRQDKEEFKETVGTGRKKK